MNDRGSTSLRVIDESELIMCLKKITWIGDGPPEADTSALGTINRPLRFTGKDGVVDD